MLLTQDRTLLEAFRQGERPALARVFAHYAPEVSRWTVKGFSYTSGEGTRRFEGFRSAVDQHDVLHEVFRAAFERQARLSYSGLTPFAGYLFIITRNIILRRLRTADRDRPLEPLHMENLAAPDPSPEERLLEEERALAVRAFLSTLSDAERRFVTLRFTDQLGQAEVGAQLGWTRKKVRLLETSVRERLVRFMKRQRSAHELLEVAYDGAR